MRDISLHIYDIAENAVEAGARHVFLSVTAHRFVLSDDGRGMENETHQNACNEGFTTRANGRGGMGLFLLKKRARRMELISTPHVGTLVDATFSEDFPLGNLAQTIDLLCRMHPHIAWICTYTEKNARVTLDTRAMARDCMKEDGRYEND